ncbi:MAG TPA: tetratricopeptide repeat protein [Steroidobacteraceae bacterium]|nr:tetratricopeptide repeat protein [Steroidobacteraceae bacterium]
MRLPKRAAAIALWLFASSAIHAQAPSGSSAVDDPDRQQAFQLYRQHKLPEAVPLLETVVSRYPTDTAAHEALGVALVSLAATEKDDAKAQSDRVQARRELLRAKELGDTSELSRVLLAEVPEKGERTRPSAQPEVDAALRDGEADFARADWSNAIAAYSRAWELDPSRQITAVYLGDAYFRTKDMDRAGEWFAKAVQIDPNVEVPYRYWGDALLAQGKMREARAKYIEGIVADPYRPTSMVGLHNWLAANELSLRKPPVELPAVPQVDAQPEKNGKVSVTIDPAMFGKGSAGAVWLTYFIERSEWRQHKFQSEFPGEKSYRHSLKEETAAMTLAIAVYRELSAKGPGNGDESLERLGKLGDEGMLEPFVLLAHADAQLAQDYPAYRGAHRDKLIGYLEEYVVPPAP